MNLKQIIAGTLAAASSLFAYGDVAVGPEEYSSFETDCGNAVVVGVSGLSWDDFWAEDYYGTQCFADERVVDAEKTAVDDDDDYWCGPITDMNLLYITGWSRKTSYATVDDMVDYFRANKTLLRYARTPGDIGSVIEGKYGYDGLFRWFKESTRVDLTPFVKTSQQQVTVSMLGTLMDKGEYALHVDVLFSAGNPNPKWGELDVTHAVTCCGYEKDAEGNLTGLFIIDSDNDQYNGEGGRNAPNSIMYCPVYFDYDMGMYAVQGIWGTTSWVLPGYTALKMYQGETKNVKLDANGGKVTPASIAVVEGKTFGELPIPTKANGEFDGWWTAKDGGVQVQEGDAVDFTTFANPKTPTLYAQWRMAHKITVTGGFLDDGMTSRSGLFRGDDVNVDVDRAKIYDKNESLVNAFANWTYTPATADLGESFDQFNPHTSVMMPNADVKLTANFVNGFAAYLFAGYETKGEAGPGEFYWSIDNGKTLIPFDAAFESGGYPVKTGKITVKFYDKTGNWRAGDLTYMVDKRGTYKDGGVTYYEDPLSVNVLATFVPVNNSTKIKLDANGGSGVAGEVLVANGCEYANLSIPSRKGYVFAGWWTAKEGGEHITYSTVVDPAAFAGQKTPTLYAHWLQYKKLTMKDETAFANWYLDSEDFDPELFDEIMQSLYMSDPDFAGGGELEGKGVLQVLPGAKVYVSVAPYAYNKNNELVFQRWTVTPSKANLGQIFRCVAADTEFVMPNEDVTLQAAYIDEPTCGWARGTVPYEIINLGYDNNLGDYVYLTPPIGAFEWSVDGGKNWYKAGMYPINGNDNFDSFDGDSALLKSGKYTVTWRSTDPQWSVPSAKATVYVTAGSDSEFSERNFSFIPEVVVDVMAYDRESGVYVPMPTAGTVTLNPKDGLIPVGKAITLTAKAAKNYAFQGYRFGKYLTLYFTETAATWKLASASYFTQYLDPSDKKMHVVAAFKKLADYSADDIVFYGFGFVYDCEPSNEVGGDGSVTIKAIVGCALDEGLGILCGEAAFPLVYKLTGKLPDGLKFDAKTGVLSGAPKKAGKTTVTITATDPANNSKVLTVNFDVAPLPSWLAGEYRGIMGERRWVGGVPLPEQQNGALEMSVKSDGKVSAKVFTRLGTRSFSGTLGWSLEDGAYPEGYFFFYSENKSGEDCDILIEPDGTIFGEASVYDKSEGYVHGRVDDGLKQDVALLAESPFLDKYYTFAFCATNSAVYDPYVNGYVGSEGQLMQSGYGYLTLKSNKKGGVKVTGQLPDGEKVTMSALVLPFVTNDVFKAKLYLFASPSSYKKQDWFAMALTVEPDGTITSDESAAWTPADVFDPSTGDTVPAQVFGDGALYSEAKSLEAYYWTVACADAGNVWQQYSYKVMAENADNPSKLDSWTEYDYARVCDFGALFNVAVKGDKKGAISLVEKSPAPWEMSWKEDGVTYKEWNYWEDKKGNPITDPSQLSISFTKATGVFTGKATVYFDYDLPSCKQNSKTKEIEWSYTKKHTTATLPYSGVIVYDRNLAEGGQNPYVGFGSAVHTYKYSYVDYSGKTKSDTKKFTLPVSLEPTEE